MIECLLKFLAHPLVTLFVGAAITWLVAWIYYKKAGEELMVEAKQLHETNSMILYVLENRGSSIEVRRDSDGRAIGLVVEAVGHATGSSSASAVGSSPEGRGEGPCARRSGAHRPGQGAGGVSHGSGILAGLKPAPGSGFRHLRPDEQAALMLIRDIDPFGMVLVDRDGVERMMLIFCYGGVFVVLLRRRRA